MKNLPKLSLGKLGILALAGLCIGVFAYDMAATKIRGALPAEAPVAGMLLNPETVPEPAEQPGPENQAVAASAEALSAADSFYAEYRLQREQVRANELELLQGIIEDESSSKEMCEKANERKLQIAQNMEYEMMTENVLFAKSFGQTVVMLGKDTATVVLSGQFDDVKAAAVAEAVAGVTGVGYENIIIINR